MGQNRVKIPPHPRDLEIPEAKLEPMIERRPARWSYTSRKSVQRYTDDPGHQVLWRTRTMKPAAASPLPRGEAGSLSIPLRGTRSHTNLGFCLLLANPDRVPHVTEKKAQNQILNTDLGVLSGHASSATTALDIVIAVACSAR